MFCKFKDYLLVMVAILDEIWTNWIYNLEWVLHKDYSCKFGTYWLSSCREEYIFNDFLGLHIDKYAVFW